MPHRWMLLLLVICAWAPAPGRAATVIITGNYVPHLGYNTIDANDDYGADFVWVRNVNCVIAYPCVNPGAPTELEVVTGGAVGYSLSVWETSRVLMSGGSIGLHLIGYGSSTIAMTGGSAAGVLAYDSSTVTITGGSPGTQLSAHTGSTIFVVGSGFAVDGVPVPYGLLPANVGVLTGLLASGDPLDTFLGDAVNTPSGSIFLLVPEPHTASFVALGLVWISSFRRRSRGARPPNQRS